MAALADVHDKLRMDEKDFKLWFSTTAPLGSILGPSCQRQMRLWKRMRVDLLGIKGKIGAKKGHFSR